MKPEELDDLFRRGLSEQHAAPRPNAWAAIQQRMTAAASQDDDDELPAFLRATTPTTSTPAPAPFMTAARGGAATQAPAAALTVSWWQRPVVRAAAAVVLLIGGGALAIQHVEPLHSAPSVATVSPADIAPAALAPVTAPASAPAQPDASVAAATSAPSATTTTTVTPPAAPAQTAPAPVVAEKAAVLVAKAPVAAPTARRRATAGPANAPESAVATFVAANHPDTTGSAARRSVAARQKATRSADLHLDDVLEVTIRPAVEPTPELPASFASNRMADADETIEIGGGTVGQLVSRATGRQSGGIISPNALLRRASGRVLEMLDRADHTADGQLTIETSVAGRPVRKTISL